MLRCNFFVFSLQSVGFLPIPTTVTPGYAVAIEGFDAAESDRTLAYLFEHQLQEKYQFAHEWSVGDLLMWENVGTLHNAVADYGPDEPRYILRCQVMADKVFGEGFLGV